jgi:hypothetical protein
MVQRSFKRFGVLLLQVLQHVVADWWTAQPAGDAQCRLFQEALEKMPP